MCSENKQPPCPSLLFRDLGLGMYRIFVIVRYRRPTNTISGYVAVKTYSRTRRHTNAKFCRLSCYAYGHSQRETQTLLFIANMSSLSSTLPRLHYTARCNQTLSMYQDSVRDCCRTGWSWRIALCSSSPVSCS